MWNMLSKHCNKIVNEELPIFIRMITSRPKMTVDHLNYSTAISKWYSSKSILLSSIPMSIGFILFKRNQHSMLGYQDIYLANNLSNRCVNYY